MNFGISASKIKNLKPVHISLIIIGMVCLSIFPMPTLGPLVLLLLGIASGILLISIFAPEDFNFLFNLFLIALFIRVFISFLFYNLSFLFPSAYTKFSTGFLFPNDGWAYSVQGWRIHKFAERGIQVTQQTFLLDPNMQGFTQSGNITPYDFFTAFVYSITGFSPLSLFFISSVTSSIAALFIYFIAKEIFSKEVARISSIFAFFWPSFIMWGTQHLKEPVIFILIFILVWSLFYMFKHFAIGFLLLSIISTFILYKIGIAFFAVVVGMITIVGIYLFINHLARNKFVALLVILILGGILGFLVVNGIFGWLSAHNIYRFKELSSLLNFLNFHRTARAAGNLQFLSNINISSIWGIMIFAPLGFLFAAFAPFPWQLGSINQIMAAPETIIFYLLVPLTVKGIIVAYNKKFTQSILLLSIIIGIIGMLGVVEGNSGTLFRHRAVAFYLLFIFTSVGIASKNES